MKRAVIKRDQNKLRIIGGKWRGRKLSFPDAEGLRPTGDRIRETLFNWLAPYIIDANVLDLFAGSGALGFEAASRLANRVILVEKNQQVAQQLQANIDTLNADNVHLVNTDALTYLNNLQKNHQNTPQNHLHQPFDLVFLDPPFNTPLMDQVVIKLKTSGLLAEHALIYVETSAQSNVLSITEDWQVLKEKTSGNVCYRLLQANCG